MIEPKNIEGLTAYVVDNKGRTVKLVPDANFVLKPAQESYEGLREAARRERLEQAGETWLGDRLTNLQNDDLSARGLLLNILNTTLASVEVDWNRANNDYGKVPHTCELAAIATALDAALKSLEEV